MLKICYVSDLHFEFNGLGKCMGKWELADVLVIAGDIAPAVYFHKDRTDERGRSCKKALEALKRDVFPKYRKVFYVMGNHDHYYGVFNRTLSLWREAFFDVPNLIILENDCVFVDDVLFAGATLWTDFNKHNPLDMLAVQQGMNDYHLIWTKGYEELDWQERKNTVPLLLPEDTYNTHFWSRQYLELLMRDNPDKKTVIITHHCPSYQSQNREHVGSTISAGYVSNLEHVILENPQIKYWICGHTHSQKSYKVGDTWVVQNECGYIMEPCYQSFKPNALFEV